jgi:hypothetical protein
VTLLTVAPGSMISVPPALMKLPLICAGIVEVHCLLDEAQTNDVRVEIEISRGLAGNCRDVMNS